MKLRKTFLSLYEINNKKCCKWLNIALAVTCIYIAGEVLKK